MRKNSKTPPKKKPNLLGKYAFISALALGGAYPLGKLFAPYVEPSFLLYMKTRQFVMFGKTWGQNDLALLAACLLAFLLVFGSMAYLWRESFSSAHKRPSKASKVIKLSVLAVLLLLGGFLYLTNMKQPPVWAKKFLPIASSAPIPLTPAQMQTGYKPEDRHELENLIHQGAPQ